MKLRGNYKLFFLIEFLTGVLLIFSFSMFGDIGMLGLGLFFIGMILTQKKEPDEREITLIYQISSLSAMVLAGAMTVIYFKFPDINWFYFFFYFSLIARGAIGFLTFKFS